MVSRRARDYCRFLQTVESFTDGQVKVSDWDSDYMSWVRLNITPKEGPYRQATLDFQIDLPRSFPKNGPSVTCHTNIYHPNIDPTCTESNVCLSLLDEWLSSFGMEDCVQGLLFLLYEPNEEDPLSPYFTGMMSDNFYRTVRLSLTGRDIDDFQGPRLISDDDEIMDILKQVEKEEEERRKQEEAEEAAAAAAAAAEAEQEKEASEKAAAEAEKPEESAVKTEEADKPEGSAVTTAEAGKAEESAVATAEADKSEGTAVTTAEAEKLEGSAVTTAEAENSDESAVTTAEADKAEENTVTTAEAKKSEESAVTTVLETANNEECSEPSCELTIQAYVTAQSNLDEPSVSCEQVDSSQNSTSVDSACEQDTTPSTPACTESSTESPCTTESTEDTAPLTSPAENDETPGSALIPTEPSVNTCSVVEITDIKNTPALVEENSPEAEAASHQPAENQNSLTVIESTTGNDISTACEILATPDNVEGQENCCTDKVGDVNSVSSQPTDSYLPSCDPLEVSVCTDPSPSQSSDLTDISPSTSASQEKTDISNDLVSVNCEDNLAKTSTAEDIGSNSNVTSQITDIGNLTEGADTPTVDSTLPKEGDNPSEISTSVVDNNTLTVEEGADITASTSSTSEVTKDSEVTPTNKVEMEFMLKRVHELMELDPDYDLERFKDEEDDDEEEEEEEEMSEPVHEDEEGEPEETEQEEENLNALNAAASADSSSTGQTFARQVSKIERVDTDQPLRTYQDRGTQTGEASFGSLGDYLSQVKTCSFTAPDYDNALLYVGATCFYAFQRLTH